jgi:hypothetical protein
MTRPAKCTRTRRALRVIAIGCSGPGVFMVARYRRYCTFGDFYASEPHPSMSCSADLQTATG